MNENEQILHKKIDFKISPAMLQSFCLSLKVLRQIFRLYIAHSHVINDIQPLFFMHQ